MVKLTHAKSPECNSSEHFLPYPTSIQCTCSMYRLCWIDKEHPRSALKLDNGNWTIVPQGEVVVSLT